MKIYFTAHFYTDGDYSFRQDRLNMLFDSKTPLYNNCNIEYEYEVDGEEINISFIAEGDANACRWALRDLLQSLICSISTIKYWLVKDLYDLLNYFLEDLWDSSKINKTRGLSGNYCGTVVNLLLTDKK